MLFLCCIMGSKHISYPGTLSSPWPSKSVKAVQAPKAALVMCKSGFGCTHTHVSRRKFDSDNRIRLLHCFSWFQRKPLQSLRSYVNLHPLWEEYGVGVGWSRAAVRVTSQANIRCRHSVSPAAANFRVGLISGNGASGHARMYCGGEEHKSFRKSGTDRLKARDRCK